MSTWWTSVDQRFRALASEHPDQAALVVADTSGASEVLSYRDLERSTRPSPNAASDGADLIRCSPDLDTVRSVVAGIRTGRLVALIDRSNRGISDASASEQITELTGRQVGARGGEASQKSAVGPGGIAFFTGGTTGQPALVQRREWPQWRSGRASPLLYERTGWRSGQTQLLVGAWAHAAPLTHLLEGLLAGNTLVTPTVFQPELVFWLMERHEVQWSQVSPSHLQILQSSVSEHATALAHLAGIVHTGGPCPEVTRRLWIASIGAERLWEVYAASEGLGYTLGNAAEWLNHPGTVGRGFMTRIRIRDAAGHTLPPEQVGSIYMRAIGSDTNTVSSRSTAGADGFRTVGDRGRLDQAGYLYLAGRADDMVTVGAENVYTGHVTAALLDYPSVVDAAVVPLDDPVFGTRLVGLVVAARAVSRQEITYHCLRRLAPHEVPDIVLVASLNRTAAGKTQPDVLHRLATDTAVLGAIPDRTGAGDDAQTSTH